MLGLSSCSGRLCLGQASLLLLLWFSTQGGVSVCLPFALVSFSPLIFISLGMISQGRRTAEHLQPVLLCGLLRKTHTPSIAQQCDHVLLPNALCASSSRELTRTSKTSPGLSSLENSLTRGQSMVWPPRLKDSQEQELEEGGCHLAICIAIIFCCVLAPKTEK